MSVCTYKVSDEYLKKQSHLINMVKENREGYTQRQFEQAKRAQELYHIVGMPTIESIKALIKMNAIKNCPVTTEDVNNAEKIFGTNMLRQPQRQIDKAQVYPGKGRRY
jgi:hypothetical protein